MKHTKTAAALLATLLAFPALAQQAKPADPRIERGRYLVKIAGCNDCHTAGYAQTGGKVPEAQWLTGDVLGWQGPWGTTYPVNLRTYMQGMTEDQWVKKAKSLTTRPPMPWFALHDMTSADLRALHRYIRHLGPAGEPAPAYVPPGQSAAQPYIKFPGD
jgi:mono/diheme cytochrome c family protein